MTETFLTPEQTPEQTHSGLDLRWVESATRPQDDLFGHVNGRWLATHEIPGDRAQDGAFRALRDRAEEDVRAIVEESAAAGNNQIGDLYTSFMAERSEERRVGKECRSRWSPYH